MSGWKKYVFLGFATFPIFLVLAGIHGQTGLSNDTNQLLVLGGGVVSATIVAFHHQYTTTEYDERRVKIRHRAGYVTFMAIYFLLTLYAIGGVSGEATLYVNRETFVLFLWCFATAMFGVSLFWTNRTSKV